MTTAELIAALLLVEDQSTPVVFYVDERDMYRDVELPRYVTDEGRTAVNIGESTIGSIAVPGTGADWRNLGIVRVTDSLVRKGKL